jgi:hypothetical protein
LYYSNLVTFLHCRILYYCNLVTLLHCRLLYSMVTLLQCCQLWEVRVANLPPCFMHPDWRDFATMGPRIREPHPASAAHGSDIAKFFFARTKMTFLTRHWATPCFKYGHIGFIIISISCFYATVTVIGHKVISASSIPFYGLNIRICPIKVK